MSLPDSLAIHFELQRALQSNLYCPLIKSRSNGVCVYRLLDPELKESYVSLGRLFLANGLGIAQGLVRFKISNYSLDLARLAPFHDIWCSLSVVRKVALDLDCFDQLSTLLDKNTHQIWTVYEAETSALVFNWKVPSLFLSLEQYSLETITSTAFSHLIPLREKDHIRIACSPHMPLPARDQKETLYSELIIWSVIAWEEYNENRIPLNNETQASQYQFLFRSWSALIQILNTHPRAETAPLADVNTSTEDLHIDKNSLSDPVHLNLWLSEMTSKIVSLTIRSTSRQQKNTIQDVKTESTIDTYLAPAATDPNPQLQQTLDTLTHLLKHQTKETVQQPQEDDATAPRITLHISQRDWLIIAALIFISHLLLRTSL